MRFGSIVLVAGLALSCSATAGDLTDDFSDPKFKGRLAERGAWRFEHGVATCEADPKLYKEFNNHGPILKWPVDCTSGTVEFEMKPSECQRVVFTLNGDGHIFRVSLVDPRQALTPTQAKGESRILAWATKSSKQNKGDTIKPEGLPLLSDINGRWTRVKLVVEADHADLVIGEMRARIEHDALTRDKNMIMLTFASGSLSVRNFQFTE